MERIKYTKPSYINYMTSKGLTEKYLLSAWDSDICHEIIDAHRQKREIKEMYYEQLHTIFLKCKTCKVKVL